MPTQGAMNPWKFPDRRYCQRSMQHNPAIGIMSKDIKLKYLEPMLDQGLLD